ncbi:AAA family ATPase [Chelatococcus asaccharovorans]|uniref:AAA family ATPase n=1 Tax=Chelatococcus asaccharovorans TaxID=28210 RepID=UPI0022644744|nr:AAA family ATPase [Chelatococcus asaccharovorans]
MAQKIETDADKAVRACLDSHRSFALIAGTGSGKTSSLVEALERIREREGRTLRQYSQRVACITFTKRAVEVIKTRLGFDDLYFVSTLHSFVWDQIGRFQSDIREALREHRLPALIAKEREKDNGGASRTAQEARAKADRFEQELAALESLRASSIQTPGSETIQTESWVMTTSSKSQAISLRKMLRSGASQGCASRTSSSTRPRTRSRGSSQG